MTTDKAITLGRINEAYAVLSDAGSTSLIAPRGPGAATCQTAPTNHIGHEAEADTAPGVLPGTRGDGTDGSNGCWLRRSSQALPRVTSRGGRPAWIAGGCPDPLAPSRGVFNGVVLSLLFWAASAAAVWAWLFW